MTEPGEEIPPVTCPLCHTEFPVPPPRPAITLEQAAGLMLADIDRARRRLLGEDGEADD